MATYSLIIRNGSILDGRKTPLFLADIGIHKDRIEKIGNLSFESAEKEIDARGRYIVPGFIDITSHSDTFWTIFDFPRQESLLWQGITTILGGNCGASLAPLVSGVEIDALQKWTDTTTININWQSMAEFMEEMAKHPVSVNFATLVGFGTLRRGVLQNANAPASPAEIEKMKYLLENALRAGAFGLSTSLDRSHEQLAGINELAALARIVQKNQTLLKHHIRNEGESILPAISEVLSVAREVNSQQAREDQPLMSHISHFKILGRQSWKHFDEIIHMLEQSRTDGMPVTIDIFPYTHTNSDLYLLLPPWAREGGKDKILLRLNDPQQRRDVAVDLKKLTLHYERMIVASTFRDETALGKTIAGLAGDTGLSPEEVCINLLIANDLHVSIFNEVISPEHIIAMAGKNYAAFATDGAGFSADSVLSHKLPHPRSFGTFPKILQEFVKEKSILSWEDAVYKMTGLPADILGLKERGVIRENAYADVVVFNPETISDKATYENPLQYALGVEWVCVNGKIALEGGRVTQEMNGRILRKNET
ncbi:MAG: amidohydrolase family protein [Candidatus Niyogibacteria bacterium]|nr:amidohydrolase family protein [Candidatus Niyogibacteria bacterium]